MKLLKCIQYLHNVKKTKKMKNILLIQIFFVSLLFGCSSPREIIKEVPVETIKTEYKNVYLHDSIYIQDSTNMYISHDTVYKERIKTQYISKIVYDTLLKTDTIPQIVEKTITNTVTEKKPQWWPVWLFLIIEGGFVLCYFYFKKNKFKLFKI